MRLKFYVQNTLEQNHKHQQIHDEKIDLNDCQRLFAIVPSLLYPVANVRTKFNFIRAPLSIMRSGGNNIVNDFSNCCANLLFYYYDYFFVRLFVAPWNHSEAFFFLFLPSLHVCSSLISLLVVRERHHVRVITTNCVLITCLMEAFKSTQFSRCSLLWEFCFFFLLHLFCSRRAPFYLFLHCFIHLFICIYWCIAQHLLSLGQILLCRKGALIFINYFNFNIPWLE